MMIELFVFFEIVMIALFLFAFFFKQEILWALTIVLSGVLMFTSYNIEYYVYHFNATISAYQPVVVNFSYPYLMGLNVLFFGLSIILVIFDIFDKYSQRYVGRD